MNRIENYGCFKVVAFERERGQRISSLQWLEQLEQTGANRLRGSRNPSGRFFVYLEVDAVHLGYNVKTTYPNEGEVVFTASNIV